MNQRAQEQVLRHVAAEWAARPAAHRPAGVWISRHAPLPAMVDTLLTAQGPATPVEAVWFLDRRGLQPRSPHEVARFYTVQVVRPWCARVWPDPSLYTEPLGLGLAAFAEYAEGGDLYLEVTWGNRDASGLRLAAGADGRLAVRQMLWVS